MRNRSDENFLLQNAAKGGSGTVKYMDRRLEPYRALVPFLGQALGPDYEVALHDLTGETGAVAALANGGARAWAHRCAAWRGALCRMGFGAPGSL